jgi:peptidoglycan/LPS O-acetylase OafA/YrhL
MKAFRPIEGLRFIFNFWIVALHQHMIQKCMFGMYKNIAALDELGLTVWSGIALGNGYQVDIFFMLSGFLLSWGLLQKKSCVQNSSIFGVVVTLVLFIIKRVLRLWPVLISVLALAYFAQDFNATNFDAVVAQLAIPNYTDETPQAVVPGWSNRVDLECCVVLFLVLTILRSIHCLNWFTTLLLVPISLIPKGLRFLSDPDMFSYMRLAANVMTTAITIAQDRQEYYRDVLFKGIHTYETVATDPRMTPMFWNEYIIYHQRWSPFFVGLALAAGLQRAYAAHDRDQQHKQQQEKKKMTPEDKQSSKSFFQSLCGALSYLTSLLLLVVSVVLAALPVLMALSPPTPEVRATVLSNPPLEADFFVSVLGRTLNCCGWAYILYRCLLPEGHPLRLTYVAGFLGNPLFQFLGKHSYCIYMLHYLVLHYVNYAVLPPAVLDSLTSSSTGDKLLVQYLISLAAGYTITLVLSMVVVFAVEEPLLRLLQAGMAKVESAVFGAANRNKDLVGKKKE